MKVTKSQLKELIKRAIVEDIMDKEIKNPKTGNMIKLRTALQLPDEHPANKKAKGMIAKAPAPKGRPTKKGSAKDIDKKSMSAADAANAKMDADAEKAKEKEDDRYPAEKVHDRVGEFMSDNEDIPDEYTDALEDLQDKLQNAGTDDEVEDLSKKALQMMDDIEQRGIAGKFDKPEEKPKEKPKKKKGFFSKLNPFSKKESVKESTRRFTVKEVRMWMKKLEENRYKKVYNADARRVSWMANNEGVELSEMPKSMSKKWTKAQYGRERYLATEFVKSKSEQMTEGKLRKVIREILKEQLNLNEYVGAGKPIPRNKAKYLFVPENQMIRFSRVYKKLIQKGFVYIGDQSKEKKKINKHYTVTIDKKMYNDVLDSLMSKSFKIKT